MSNAMKDWLADMKWEEEQARRKGMCLYCDPESSRCRIWQSEADDFYLDVETSEWDDYDEDYIHIREYIDYCPFCGRELVENV